jgi:hypothetical protein
MTWNLLGQSSDVTSAIMISLLLIGLTIAGFFVVVMVRRKTRDMTTEATAAGFTLSDLRALHRSGKINDEEFERAKGRLIAEAKAASKTDADAAGNAGVGTTGKKPQPTEPNESASDAAAMDGGQSGNGGAGNGGGGD